MMLETEYKVRGPKGKFTTKAFTFNAKFQTPYVLDFSAMTQTNTESKAVRRIVHWMDH